MEKINNIENELIITDMYNNLIIDPDKEHIPFILVRSRTGINLLKKIGYTKHSSIWTLKYNIDNYNILGHFWITGQNYNENEPILLARDMTYFKSRVNNILTEYPVDYHLVSTYNDGYIWRPICKNGYVALGMLYSKEKPLIYDCVTVISCSTIPYNGWYNVINNMTNMNEYNLLWYNLYDRLTLDIDKIIVFDTELIRQQKKEKREHKENLSDRLLTNKCKNKLINPSNRLVFLTESQNPWYENKNNIMEQKKYINTDIINSLPNEIKYNEFIKINEEFNNTENEKKTVPLKVNNNNNNSVLVNEKKNNGIINILDTSNDSYYYIIIFLVIFVIIIIKK